MENIKHGNKKKLFEWLGLKQSFGSAIITGHRRPSPARALELEKISGISIKSWLFMDADRLRGLVFKAWENKK